MVNSGSSANLIAISTLTSPKIKSDKRINKGDEVITVAAGFPTTVSPLFVGAVPVFVDADPLTGNICCDDPKAYNLKSKAVMLAHALGNLDISAILEFCYVHNLWLIEDNCDALGCTYSMPKSLAVRL